MQFRLYLLCFFSLWFIGCSSTDLQDSKTAEGAFKLGQEYEDAERYEEAISKFTEVKNKHPYSKYAIEAKLHIADIHFKREAFIEAQHDYELFKEFHPKHARIDYVTYRLGLSYFNQLPSSIDRDLSLADKAITYFSEVISSYPKSEYVKPAIEKKTEAIKMLAEKEFYIADFYFKRDFYDSALPRYENVLIKYHGLGFDLKALSQAALSAAKAGEKDKAQQYLSQLLKEYPNANETRKVQSELKSL